MQIAGFQKTTLLDFPGRVAATVFTPSCNFRCPYCHNMDIVCPQPGQPMFTEEEVLGTLIKRKNILEGVCITGGECTLQADLADFIKKIKDTGLAVKIDTNGTNPDMVEELMGAGLIDYVAMDIKQCPEKYNEVALWKQYSVEKIERTIGLLKGGSIDYEFRTTVPDNLFCAEDFEKIGQWISGAKAYYLQCYSESDYVADKSCTVPKKETLEKYAKIMREFVPTVGIRGVD